MICNYSATAETPFSQKCTHKPWSSCLLVLETGPWVIECHFILRYIIFALYYIHIILYLLDYNISIEFIICAYQFIYLYMACRLQCQW